GVGSSGFRANERRQRVGSLLTPGDTASGMKRARDGARAACAVHSCGVHVTRASHGDATCHAGDM
ncbi:MAG: hypothetical protein VX265_14870, partial [Myxococcota bacterium]|nr:hypothetical protein [Myxococcota bacterium]